MITDEERQDGRKMRMGKQIICDNLYFLICVHLRFLS